MNMTNYIRTNQRWPDRVGWDNMANAIETLAKSCGGHAYCAQKYEYLSVELQQPADTPEQTKALYVMIELVEQISDLE